MMTTLMPLIRSGGITRQMTFAEAEALVCAVLRKHGMDICDKSECELTDLFGDPLGLSYGDAVLDAFGEPLEVFTSTTHWVDAFSDALPNCDSPSSSVALLDAFGSPQGLAEGDDLLDAFGISLGATGKSWQDAFGVDI